MEYFKRIDFKCKSNLFRNISKINDCSFNLINTFQKDSNIIKKKNEIKEEPIIIKPFSECTIQEIVDVSELYYTGRVSMDQIRSVWHVGDTVVIANTMTGPTQFQILDFAFDDLSYGYKGHSQALLTLGTVNTLINGIMGSSGATNVTYETSVSRSTFNETFYNGLECKDAIKPVMKLVSEAPGSARATIDKVFILSEEEIFGNCTYSHRSMKPYAYSYFRADLSRSRKHGEYSNSYWLRSLVRGSSDEFCIVDENGNIGTSKMYLPHSYVVAFCI